MDAPVYSHSITVDYRSPLSIPLTTSSDYLVPSGNGEYLSKLVCAQREKGMPVDDRLYSIAEVA